MSHPRIDRDEEVAGWLTWVSGPEMDEAEAREFYAFTRQLTIEFWPLLGLLISACALAWWPLDPIVFRGEPAAIAAFGRFRGRLVVLDVVLSLVLPRWGFARRNAHTFAAFAASTNIAMSGWLFADAGQGAPAWVHYGFITPMFSVLLVIPLLGRTIVTLLFGLTVYAAWLLHPATTWDAGMALEGMSFQVFVCGLSTFIGHLLFVQVQRSYHLRRRVDAQRDELVQLTDHLEDRVDRQTAQIRELSERARHVRTEQRRETARELHDGIGQELTSLRLLVGLRSRLHPEAHAADAFADLDEQIERLQASLRGILESLRPAPLADGSLPDALGNLAGEIERRSGLRCTFVATRSPIDLPTDTSLALFRIAQEGLTNAVRHARAKTLVVRLEGAAGQLVLSVTDDGVGLDPDRLGTGHGTRNIRERAQQLGGTARWSVDGGTRLDVTVPLERAP